VWSDFEKFQQNWLPTILECPRCRNFCSNSAVERGLDESKPVNSNTRTIHKLAKHYRILPTLAGLGSLES